jgi:preprotein translocase subunit SecD
MLLLLARAGFASLLIRERSIMKILQEASSQLLALLLLLCVAVSCTTLSGPRDKGGFYLVLAVKADEAQLDQSIERTMAVIQKRCDSLAIYCKPQRQSGDKSNRIMLRVSSTLDQARVKTVLLSQGLELRAVVSPPSPTPVQLYATQAEAAAAAGKDEETLPYVEREVKAGSLNGSRFVILKRAPIITGEDITQAAAVARFRDINDEDYQITFRVKPEGAERFGSWTGANINNYIAIVWNKEVRSIAFIKSQITDSGEISGRYTKEQAEDVALVLKSGNLPASVELVEEGTYKP